MKAFKRIFALILSVLITTGTMVTVFALPPAPTDEFGNPLPYTPLQGIEITPAEGDWKYEDYFVEYLNSQYENENFEYYYEEIYESYPAVGNPSTPDYVLVECYKDYIDGEGDYTVTLGNYEIKGYYYHRPYDLGYFIFVPETEKIYTLEEAVEADIIGVYNGVEQIDYDPYYDIQSYCGLQILDVPGGGTTPAPDINFLGSEKGAEIYEFTATSIKDDTTTRTVGDWEITGEDYGKFPYSYGIFVYYKSQVYTLDEALEKGIVTDIFCVNDSKGTRVENKALSNKCKYAYLNHLNYTPTEKDTVYCKALGTIRSNTVFTAYIEPEDAAFVDETTNQVIGNYLFSAPHPVGPEDNPIGLYVLTNDRQVVPALTAYKSGLVSDEELSKLANGEPCNPYDPYNIYDYEDVIIPMVLEKYVHEDIEEITSYSEIYKHYQHMGPDMPDYVLISLHTNLGYPMPIADLFGDNLIYRYSGNVPFAYGYGIYIPETNKLYSLSDAAKRNIEGVEEALDHITYSALMGDNDCDKRLTIKDATYLQKCLAGLEKYRDDDVIEAFQYDDNPPARYISDYNRDGNRNIKDATAIQKKLAKITE